MINVFLRRYVSIFFHTEIMGLHTPCRALSCCLLCLMGNPQLVEYSSLKCLCSLWLFALKYTLMLYVHALKPWPGALFAGDVNLVIILTLVEVGLDIKAIVKR